MGMAQHLQRLVQITAPDVAAIDQPQRQNLVGRQTIKNGRILLGRPHQINMQAVHRQARRQPEAVLQTTEIGRDQLFQRLDRKSTRLNSSHVKISYAVFCLKKKKEKNVKDT